MNSIKNFVSEWAGLIVNLITLGGWVGWVLSTVLLGVSGSNGRSLADGITIGQFHLSCEMLVIIFAVCLIIVINAWLFERLLKGAANSTADYKVVCDRLPVALQQEIDVKDTASPYVSQAAAEYCSSLDEAGFKQLLNSPDASCRNLNAGSKAGKTILQCSFIPVDADKNTIIIRRRSENHASIFKKVNNWWKKIYSFISFSPISDGHNRKFDSILSCYAHEVPLDDVKLTDADFKFVGVIYNRRGGGKVERSWLPWKKPDPVRAELGKCIRYIFVVYLVEYSGLKFVCDDGKPNWTAINRAFAEASKRDSGRKDRFFLKDHDYIVGADSLIEIASRLTTVGSEESKCWLKVEQEALKRAKLMVVGSASSTGSSFPVTS